MNTLEYIQSKWGNRFVPGTSKPTEIQGLLRWDLVQMFAELGFTKGVEIGTERGHFARFIVKHYPKIELYSVDPYQSYQGYRDYLSQELLDRFYDEAKLRLSKYPNSHLVRKTSMEALHDFEDNSLDFVFIDGNHEIPWVLDDICWWSTKVRFGGIVSGHDYFVSKKTTRTQIHVKYALDCHAASFYVDPYFVLGAKSDWEDITKANERPSWFYVKDKRQWTIWGFS